MGWEGRVALKGPSKLAPYVSLPKTYDGTTAYFSGIKVNGTSTWIETAIPGCECGNFVKSLVMGIELTSARRYALSCQTVDDIRTPTDRSDSDKRKSEALTLDSRRSSLHDSKYPPNCRCRR